MDTKYPRATDTFGLIRASKQIHEEIEAQFFRDHSLAIIITITRDPSTRQASFEKAQSGNPGLILDGTYSQLSSFFNSARFSFIKLLIELPGGMYDDTQMHDLNSSIFSFSRCFMEWQIDVRSRKGQRSALGTSPSKRFEIIIYGRTYPDGRGRDQEFCLPRLAELLQVFRCIEDAEGTTLKADFDFLFGNEWLPELLDQVAYDMQNSGWPKWEQWRQKNMQLALDQCSLFTISTRYTTPTLRGPLPIGLPEKLTDDTTEYITDRTSKYKYDDYKVFLNTGKLPYHPPGRPITVKVDTLPFLLMSSGSSSDASPEITNHQDGKSPDMTPGSGSTKTLDQEVANSVVSGQSTPPPSNKSGFKLAPDSTSNIQISTDTALPSNPSTLSATAIDAPVDKRVRLTPHLASSAVIHPWNKYMDSPILKAKETPSASSKPQAPTHDSIQPSDGAKETIQHQAKFTSLELTLIMTLLKSESMANITDKSDERSSDVLINSIGDQQRKPNTDMYLVISKQEHAHSLLPALFYMDVHMPEPDRCLDYRLKPTGLAARNMGGDAVDSDGLERHNTIPGRPDCGSLLVTAPNIPAEVFTRTNSTTLLDFPEKVQTPMTELNESTGPSNGGTVEIAVMAEELDDSDDGPGTVNDNNPSPGPIAMKEMKARPSDHTLNAIVDDSPKMTSHSEHTVSIHKIAVAHVPKLNLIPQRLTPGESVVKYWVLILAGLSLLTVRPHRPILDWNQLTLTFDPTTVSRESLAPRLLALVADLMPWKVDVTLQGSVTIFVALVPLWIVTARGVKILLRKAFSSLSVWGYLILLTSALQIYDPDRILSLLPSSIYLGHLWIMWQTVKQFVSFSTFSRCVFMMLVLGNVYNFANKLCSKVPDDNTQTGITNDDPGMIGDPVTSGCRPDQPCQPGLGNLRFLPPEIRSHIWKELFTPSTAKPKPRIYEMHESRIIEATSRKDIRNIKLVSGMIEDRKQSVESMMQAGKQSRSQRFRMQNDMSILRTSQQLSREIRGDLYRGRTLKSCFNNNEHGLLLHHVGDKTTEYYITLGGFCVARDFADTDFSMFKSLHLDIELPSNECSRDKMHDLKTHLEHFSELIQDWQSRRYHDIKRRCPRIDIDIRLHKDTRLYHFEWFRTFSWEISLDDIHDVLQPLRAIDNVEDVMIKVHFALRFGQEWLPQVLHEVCHQMKRKGDYAVRDHRRTRYMCHEANQLTWKSLGSEIGGPLSEQPPAKLWTDNTWEDTLKNLAPRLGRPPSPEYDLEPDGRLYDAHPKATHRMSFAEQMARCHQLGYRLGPSLPFVVASFILFGPSTCFNFISRNVPFLDLMLLYFLRSAWATLSSHRVSGRCGSTYRKLSSV
ncbi:MAG: hypothetical protein Q9169_006746, partial [Polycauliona sp. 2 TL-2023]